MCPNTISFRPTTQKPDLNRREAQENSFGNQFANRQSSSSLPQLRQGSGSNLESALAKHAKQLEEHEARVQAQLALMGIDKRQEVNQIVDRSSIRDYS